MARIDKTDSKVGVVRGTLGVDLDPQFTNELVGIGLDSSGHIVPGAGQTGIVGLMNPNPKLRRAGARVDYFKLGDFVDLDDAFAPGRIAVADNTTGAVTTPEAVPADGVTRVGEVIDPKPNSRLVIDIKIGA